MSAQRDPNRKVVLQGVSSTDLVTPVTIAVNPVTGGVLTETTPKITVSATEPTDPAEGDLWVDIS